MTNPGSLTRTLLATLLLALLATGCDLAAGGQEAQTGAEVAGQAQNLSVQADLRDAMTAARTFYSTAATYTGVAPSTLGSLEPGTCFVSSIAASSPGGRCEAGSGTPPISVFGEGSAFAAAAVGPSGSCFWIRDVIGQGTFYGSGEPCTGQAALAAAQSDFPA
jgi:hypothetical protein